MIAPKLFRFGKYFFFLTIAICFVNIQNSSARFVAKKGQPVSPLTEDFESGSKSSYAADNVQLNSGSWYFSNALLGSTTSDQKNGTKSVRIKTSGSIRMNFDYPEGASTITIKHATFGLDGSSTWELQVSNNHGNTFTTVGSSFTSSTPSLQTVTFTVNIPGSIRIAIVKTDGSSNRINIDDVQINPYSGTGSNPALDDDHMLLGNPSNATSDTDSYDNYLMIKTYYTVCYNRDQGKPNWVSWHIQASDLDTFSRSEDFRADDSLPASWYHVCKTCYANSGFDRGHLCPSADRTATEEANSATFLMTNMMPQAPYNNQHTWANLESYERVLVRNGNEVYIIAGSYGIGGTGSKGTKNTINNGHVTVPNKVWKVIVVIPDGTNDLSRISTASRVIAVMIPNINTTSTNWKQYRTSVRAIELATGYNLLSNVPAAIQQVIETKVDNE